MGQSRPALIVGAMVVVVVGVVVAAALVGSDMVLDLAVGAVGVALGVALWRASRVTSLEAMAFAVSWFAGSAWTFALYWHRGVLVCLVLASPAAWTRSRVAGWVMVACCVAALVGGLWQRNLIAVALVCAVFIAAAAEGRGRLPAAAVLSFAVFGGLVPDVVDAQWAPHAALAVYEVLVLVVLALTWRRMWAPSRSELTDVAVQLPSLMVRDAPELARLLEADPGLVAGSDLRAAVHRALQLHRGNEVARNDVRHALAEAAAARRRLVASEASERLRLAAELQSAAALPMADLIDRAAGLESAEAALRRASASLAVAVHGLRPVGLDQGLAVALRSMPLAEALSAVVDATDARCPEIVEDTLYAVVSEALANVAKHVGRCRVRVRYWNDGVVACVEVDDDGGGGASDVRGGGLAHLRDRVAALDGELEVVSAPGAGTSVKATVPAVVQGSAHCLRFDHDTLAGGRTPATTLPA